ncbi:MAG: hypothetical protein AAB383_04760 [Patescibacteria group bacterium]
MNTNDPNQSNGAEQNHDLNRYGLNEEHLKQVNAWAEILVSSKTWPLDHTVGIAAHLKQKLIELQVFEQGAYENCMIQLQNALLTNPGLFEQKDSMRTYVARSIGIYFQRRLYDILMEGGVQDGYFQDFRRIVLQLRRTMQNKWPSDKLDDLLVDIDLQVALNADPQRLDVKELRIYQNMARTVNTVQVDRDEKCMTDRAYLMEGPIYLYADSIQSKSDNLGEDHLIQKGRLTVEEINERYNKENDFLTYLSKAIIQHKASGSKNKFAINLDPQEEGDAVKRNLFPSSYHQLLTRIQKVAETSGSKQDLLNAPISIKAWLNTFEKDFEGDRIAYIHDRKNPGFASAAQKHLNKANSDGLFKTLLYAASHSNNNGEIVLALVMLARHCEEDEGETPTHRLYKIVTELLKEPDLKKLFIFFAAFEDPAKMMQLLMTAVYAKEGGVKYTVKKDRVDFNKIKITEILDQETIQKFYQKLLNIQGDSKSVEKAVNSIDTKTFKEPDTLWDEMAAKRSIVLGETQEIDMTDLLPSSWHIFISPKNGTDTYSLKINITEKKGHRLDVIEIHGKLDENGFKSGVILSDEVRAKIHKIGSTAAHRYFVRAKIEDEVKSKLEDKLGEITGADPDDGAGTDLNDTGAEPEQPETSLPPEENAKEPNVTLPVKEARASKDSLSIDIRAIDREDDSQRQKRIRKKMLHSNKMLKKHLTGESLSDEDLKELLLFRKEASSMAAGESVYPLIKDPQERRALLTEDPTGKNLWVMVRCPHSKAAGFYLHKPGSKASGPVLFDVEKVKATDHSVWSYEVYLDNGFEPMGDKELKPYDSIAGLKADADPKLEALINGIKKAYPENEAYAKNAIQGSTATLHVPNQLSNRIFNQGTYISMEEFLKIQVTK